MIPRFTRLVLSLGLTSSLAVAFVPLGCGSSEASFGPILPGNDTPELPELTAKALARCLRHSTAPFPPTEDDTYAVSFDLKISMSGNVTWLGVHRSALPGHVVESCLGGVLLDMELPMRPIARADWDQAPQDRGAPPSRALLATPALAAAPISLVPVVLAGLGVIVVVTIVLYVVTDSGPRTTTEAPPAVTAAPVASAAPTATAVPLATAIPKARRYPNQTCDNEVLDRLEDEKKRLCSAGHAADCRPNRSEKLRGRIPCSAILLSIHQRLPCLAQRKLIQRTCFGGAPDAGHEKAIDQEQDGINNCEALKLINCAKGHPMAGL